MIRSVRHFSILISMCFAVAQNSELVRACDPGWLPGDGFPGLRGSVEALITWDADGAGPVPSLLIAGGSNILYADSEPASNIVAYDGDHWFSLGAGLSGGSVRALTFFNDELIAGGNFTFADGLPANRIARWDGTAWHALGAGVNSTVNALAVYNSQLYASGSFDTAGGIAANHIAKWNGTTWSTLGTGITGTPFCMEVYDGFLYVGGLFTQAGGLAASNLARWNGAAWSIFGAPNNTVLTMTSITVGSFPNFNNILYLGGYFTAIGATSANHIAAVSTASGHYGSVGGGLTDPCRRIIARNTGGGNYEVIAITMPNPGTPQQVWRYNAGVWNVMGSFNYGTAQPLAYFNNQYVVGGFGDPANTPAIQSWDGTAWVPLGRGIGGNIKALTTLGADVIAGGDFDFVSNVRVNNIARRDAVTGDWSPLASGINGPVHALLTLPSGDVIAGGDFTSASGTLASRIARWNGTNWSSLGSGLNGPVNALLLLSNGDVIVGGAFTAAGGGTANRVARWNGAMWSSLGAGFADGTVYSLAVRANGQLMAGGNFQVSGSNWGQVAYLSGSAWTIIGFGNNFSYAYSMAAMPNGDIIAGGYFETLSGGDLKNVRRWDGTSWTDLGLFNGQVKALNLLPSGDVIAAGHFTTINGIPASRIARWNGTTWSALDEGLSDFANALVVFPSGELAVGGEFILAGDEMSARFAHWFCGPPCLSDADCKSDAAGANPDNACNCASCDDGFCVYTCSKFGNASCDAGELVNLDDILCVLSGFAGFANCHNGDVAPCGGNGSINLDDILGVLNAFAGGDPCGCLPEAAAPMCDSTSP